ncbi:hypothetical protein EG329_002335 [Mollisiaceae sp. DMI_Dod_QoI]|nr:hypothetical protein EG329_002335 [Helotiales sp. DMI_Dod_QoI]
MASNIPNTIALRSDEVGSVLDRTDLIELKAYEISHIISWYKEDYFEANESAEAWRRHHLVAQWYEWCDCQYPGTNPSDWQAMASAAGEDVDIRLLIRGHSIAGYAILLFLEACYAVDKALCGMDAEALAKVKMWHMPQEMRAYKYLLSEEMMQWWAKELVELENEIKSPFSNRVSLSWRIRDLSECVRRLEVVMESGEGMGTNIWTTMGEQSDTEPPAGVDVAIYDRVDRLRTSVEILRKILERSEQGDVASNILPSTSHKAVELEGIRRRIPRAASPSNDEHELGGGQTSTASEENITPTSAVVSQVASSIQFDSLLGVAPPTPVLQHLQSIFELATSRFKMFIVRYKANKLLVWLVDKETAFIISLCLIVTSVFFVAWSTILTKSQPAVSFEHSLVSDPNFLGNLSQSILSNLSIYLVIASTVRSRSV